MAGMMEGEMMASALSAQLRVTARSTSFRRAGMAFGREPTLIALAALTASAALALITEVELVCELGDGEVFQRIDASEVRLVAMLEKLRDFDPDGALGQIVPAEFMASDIFQEFMTGQVEGEETHSPTPQSNASTASDAAAATGDDASQTATDTLTASSGEEQPAADAAPAPVAALVPPAAEGVTAPSPSVGKPSGRSPRASSPKASEAKAAS